MAVILRAPSAKADWFIDHNRARLHAVRERGRINVGLERGTRLAQRVDGPIELALPVVAAADHNAQAAVEIDQYRSRLRGVVFATVLPQRALDCDFRRALQV